MEALTSLLIPQSSEEIDQVRNRFFPFDFSKVKDSFNLDIKTFYLRENRKVAVKINIFFLFPIAEFCFLFSVVESNFYSTTWAAPQTYRICAWKWWITRTDGGSHARMDEGKKNFPSKPDELVKTFSFFSTPFTKHLNSLQWFPYDFRGEEIMSLVKHIVARCVANTQLADRMSDMCSALLIKLTDLSQFEEEMKSNKKSLSEVTWYDFYWHSWDEILFRQQPMIEWPNSSKLAQLLCHIEKKFAKHIGPEEFLQCSLNLIKQQSNYDVPTTSASVLCPQSQTQDAKKKTCNLENYFEWSNRLRLLVANEILQVTSCKAFHRHL